MFDTPQRLRKAIRNGEFSKPTSGAAADYVQANVVIVPKEYAFDFFLFAHRNKKSCPLVDVLEPGQVASRLAKDSDIRTDVPKYRIYKEGQLVDEVSDIRDIWQDDFVTFLIGCSFTFEQPLIDASIPLRHIEEGKNVAMYVTNKMTEQAGVFHGPLVVSMRPIKKDLVNQASEITAQFPNMHGAPIHVGSPEAIGIDEIDQPDFGDYVPVHSDETPVFWACGVTPQMAAIQSKIPLMITHSPGHMFVTDVTNHEFLSEVES